jgi:hypothetical protein
MITPPVVKHFYGPGVDAHLRCDAEACTLDIAVDCDLLDQEQPQVRLKVLLQPTDPNSGLPYGGPLNLFKETVQLRASRPQQRAHGRSWLTGVAPQVAQNCYYRIITDGET